MTKKDKGADRRLQRKYGITLKEYNEMLAAQGGGCAICGSVRKKVRLSVDHNHKLKYLKVVAVKGNSCWVASFDKYPIVQQVAPNRNKAIQLLRRRAVRMSVRGILCFSCNGGLRKYRDNWKFLLNASRYLRIHQQKVEGVRK